MRATGFGKHVEAVEAGICPWYSSMKTRKEDFKNEISWREFGISGLCQKYQDGFFE